MERTRSHVGDVVFFVLGLLASIAIGLMASDPAIGIAFLALPVSFLVAKHFGDVAGNKAAIAYAEEQAKQARFMALQALCSEIDRIRMLARHNLELVDETDRPHPDRSALRMPVAAFEIAFFSKETVMRDIREDPKAYAYLTLALEDYLTEASAINALVEMRLHDRSSPNGSDDAQLAITREIHERSQRLPEILDRLKGRLIAEMDAIED